MPNPAWPPHPDLFPEDHARRLDPDTSKDTAARVKMWSQAVQVLRSYRRVGRALIDHDAYRLAGFPPGRTSHQRCSDLRFHGFIEQTGERGVTPSKNAARLCRITPAGMAFLLALDGGVPLAGLMPKRRPPQQ